MNLAYRIGGVMRVGGNVLRISKAGSGGASPE